MQCAAYENENSATRWGAHSRCSVGAAAAVAAGAWWMGGGAMVQHPRPHSGRAGLTALALLAAVLTLGLPLLSYRSVTSLTQGQQQVGAVHPLTAANGSCAGSLCRWLPELQQQKLGAVRRVLGSSMYAGHAGLASACSAAATAALVTPRPSPPHAQPNCGASAYKLMMQVLRELREALIAAKSERDGAKQELAEARKQVRDPVIAWHAFLCSSLPLLVLALEELQVCQFA